MTLIPKLKGNTRKNRKTTKKCPKIGRFALRKFTLFKFRMMWRQFFLINMALLRSHFDRLVLRVKMSHSKGLQWQNSWSDTYFCPVGLLCAKIGVKSLILRKVPKWIRNFFFLIKKIVTKRSGQKLLRNGEKPF